MPRKPSPVDLGEILFPGEATPEWLASRLTPDVGPALVRIDAIDAAIDWLGPSDIGIEECLAVPARERGRTASERHDAIEFLKEILATGAVPTKEIFAQAGAQGFSERTLRRAKKTLGVLAFRNGTGAWAWHLPRDPAGTVGDVPEQSGTVIP